MSQQQNDEQTGGASGDRPGPPAEGVTESGYSYSVVNDAESAAPAAREDATPRPPAGNGRKISLPAWALAAAVIVPALVVGALVWLLAPDGNGGGGGSDRLERNVTNVVNAFSQGGETDGVIRYEGDLPGAFPDEIPRYPGSRVISSIVQIRGDDAGYIVVWDTEDTRQDVANFFTTTLNEDPWQVEIEQTGRESTVLQFSNIENPDIEGVVLAAESKDDDVTTIFVSINAVGAADEHDLEDFDPGLSRPLPAGFPAEEVPQYPDATIIETALQQQPGGRQYVVSMVTEDDASTVLEFYRDQFEQNGWTVEDAPPGSSQLENGEVISFTGDDGTSGTVDAGELAEDENLTRITVQVNAGS